LTFDAIENQSLLIVQQSFGWSANFATVGCRRTPWANGSGRFGVMLRVDGIANPAILCLGWRGC